MVGTPDRVLELMQAEKVDVGHVSVIALYATEEMISCGFKEQILSVVRHGKLPCRVQRCLFASAMPEEVWELRVAGAT